MAHPDHNAIVAAFQALGGIPCDRGHPTNGYTHIHGPGFPPKLGARQCATHAVAVEKYNGTVSPSAPVGSQMGATMRPQISIKKHPLGYSHRQNYGRFDHAFDVPSIQARWPTFADFVQDVVAHARRARQW